ISKPNAVLGDDIEHRRSRRCLSAVTEAAHLIDPDIVHDDEQNVRTLCGSGGVREVRCACQTQAAEHEHYTSAPLVHSHSPRILFRHVTAAAVRLAKMSTASAIKKNMTAGSGIASTAMSSR